MVRNEILQYILFRYENWHDYARHVALVHHFEGWEDDLLNDVICDLLQKDPDKLNELYTRRTKMYVNGKQTTELDKFVLKMLKINASSPVAPFRKNILGKKIINRSGKSVEVQQSVKLNGIDKNEDPYNYEDDSKMEAFHSRNISKLQNAGFCPSAQELYERYFIHNTKIYELTQDENEQLKKVARFLTENKKGLSDD